ncbi:DUF1958 domain-containing protein [Macrococcoides caseolyticum]|uniref:DUF1958 domain-containing protein n=1 Tax=Macrococcoides caseolyticum TaxID=69966 RepID=UPI001F2E9876|nr:DUF1958 domain-containing protein [Macrococcus caseolyticus]MCE4956472.1 D-alanyl-D-alanine carboxypeptidase [Macrococcus caseolyticus]
MKKIFNRILYLSLMLLIIFNPVVLAASPFEIANNAGYDVPQKDNPKGTLVIADNGQILYGENIDTKWPPASMSKLMTLYLVYEAIDKGEISLHTKVKVNDKYYGISRLPALSNNKFRLGATYTVEELIQLALIPSSNAATYMLANLIEKDDSNFVDKMNATAKKLGMSQTHYLNPAGPPNNLMLQYKAQRYQEDDDNISTARDYAILAQHIIAKHPEILKYTKKTSVVIKEGTQDEESFTTYNHSLEGARLSAKGVDGLKTGSSDTAGFNTTITAKRNHLRVIEVILGVGDWYDPPAEFNRNEMANAILDLVYSKYQYKKILSKGKHTFNGKTYYIHNDLYDVVRKGQAGKLILKDGRIHYDYERQFVSDQYHPSTVKYEDYNQYKKKQFWKEHHKTIIFLLVLSFLSGLVLMLYYYWPKLKKN